MAAHDPVALAEIDLYGDLIIAAAATPFDRLSADRIDQVLQVRPPGESAEAEEVHIPAQRDSSPS
ncbi:hypothetical protein ACEZCY_09465 [Streptacidiphilus sp. N1-12]|uniref:Uncharacterized protein n=2 Tax=Streptacidiphilus alkalitolerans TaxID=3342712 RepID=A0ABV6X683_9ACTN